MKQRRLVIFDGGYSLFWCPACNEAHAINTGPGGWALTGDAERPQTQPSIRVSSGGHTLCHCYLEGEQIRFCADCPHAMSGQTVPLPYFPMDHLHSAEGVLPI